VGEEQREKENDREIVEGFKKRERQAEKRKNLGADFDMDSRGVRSEEKKKKKQKEIHEIEEISPSAVENQQTVVFPQTPPMDPLVQRAWVRRKEEESSMTLEQLDQLSQLMQGHDLKNVNSLLIFRRCSFSFTSSRNPSFLYLL
jgi:galactokinase/mevalonate kinase-like predicted kinase